MRYFVKKVLFFEAIWLITMINIYLCVSLRKWRNIFEVYRSLHNV